MKMKMKPISFFITDPTLFCLFKNPTNFSFGKLDVLENALDYFFTGRHKNLKPKELMIFLSFLGQKFDKDVLNFKAGTPPNPSFRTSVKQ